MLKVRGGRFLWDILTPPPFPSSLLQTVAKMEKGTFETKMRGLLLLIGSPWLEQLP